MCQTAMRDDIVLGGADIDDFNDTAFDTKLTAEIHIFGLAGKNTKQYFMAMEDGH